MHTKKMLSISLLGLLALGTVFSVNSNNNIYESKITKKEIKSNPDDKWKESIIESAQNQNTIKIFFSRNASLVYQQSLISLFYMLSLDTTQPIQVNSTTIKPITFFIDWDVWEKDNKFNFEDLENNNNILFVKSTKDITNVDYSNDEPYWATPTKEHVKNILTYYQNALNNNSNLKIDIWAADLTISSMFSNCKDEMLDLIPYINKFYVLSDGNAQTFKFTPKYVDDFKNGIISNIDEVKRKWDILKNKNHDNSSERKQIMNNSIFQHYLKMEDVIVFNTLDYSDSSYWGIEKANMYNVYNFNIDYYDMATKLNIENAKKDKFIEQYQKYFKINQNKFSEFVEQGFEHYDKNKKNLVYMGDNLFQNGTTKYTDEEISKVFLAFTKKYPTDQYNYFFKHHPGLKVPQQIELTNKLIKLTNVKPILFKNFGWELFLAWDSQQQNNTSSSLDYTPFYKQNNQQEQQTILIGLQYSTTTILTTFSYLMNKHNFSDIQAYEYVSASNFPTVGTYTIAKKGVIYNLFSYEKVVNENNLFLQDIYLPYENFYNLYKNYSINSKDFSKEYDLEISSLNESKIKNNIFISISLIALIFSVLSIITFIYLYNWYKKNNYKCRKLVKGH